jgi:CheY-like chemotaxis protein
VLDPIFCATAFALGCVCTWAWTRRTRARSEDAAARAAAPTAGEGPADDASGEGATANALASELADLATGVEGHTRLLCEAIGNPPLIATHAQHLWSAVRTLRLFSEKVLAARGAEALHPVPTNLQTLLADLRQELEDFSDSGLQVTFQAAASLPLAMAEPVALRRAILFLVDTLLDRETDPGALVLRASTRVADDLAPAVVIEIRVVGEADAPAPRRAIPPRDLGVTAAANLIAGQGGELLLEPDAPGTARIRLEAALATAEAAAAGSVGPQAAPHPYGGILVVEDNPGVRALVAREMEKLGRRVFCCPDGATARSLLAATPERFELLILDGEARRQPGVQLVEKALSCSPDLKILLLGTGNASLGCRDRLRGRCKELHKPFGVAELRDAVHGLLGGGAPSAETPAAARTEEQPTA